MKKSLLSISLGAIAIIAVATVIGTHSQPFTTSGAECQHEGYHYAAKAATEYECGWHEYWVCCKCHKSYTSKPTGTFVDQDPSKMVGQVNSSMVGIYIPPLNGGSEGDYYVTDPFNE